MIKKLKNKNHGFTLLETILYVAILSTLVFGIASFVGLVSEVRVKNQVMSEVDQQAVQILEAVKVAVQSGESVSSPTIGQSQNILQIVNIDDSMTVFSLDSGVFTIDRGDGPTSLHNNRVVVDSVIFRNLSHVGTPSIVRVTINLSYKNISINQIYNYSKTYVAGAQLSK